MKLIDISDRLKTLTQYVSPYQYIVDIGTDHCFVPIYLKQKGLIEKAIASDVNAGPINEAKRNIKRYGFEDSIEARIGNGLETVTLNDRVDVIIIAGMGGKLITEILNSHLEVLKNNKRLILQANVAVDVLRTWLSDHYYEIIKEEIINDQGIIYEIIVANRVKEKVNYSTDDIVFGPILLKEQNPLFLEKWQEHLRFKKEVYQKIPVGHKNKEIILNEIKQIENVLNT